MDLFMLAGTGQNICNKNIKSFPYYKLFRKNIIMARQSHRTYYIWAYWPTIDLLTAFFSK